MNQNPNPSQNPYAGMPTAYPPQPTRPKPQVDPLTKREGVLLLIAIFLSAFLSLFTLGGGFKLGFTISYLLFLVLSTVYLLPLKKVRPYSAACGVLAAASSLLFSLFADPLIHAFAFCAMALLTAVYLLGISGAARFPDGGYRSFFDIIHLLFVDPFIHIRDLFYAARPRGDGKGKGAGTLGKVLLGVALAFPVLCVVVPLLASSDAAFSGMLESITKWISFFEVFLVFFGVVCSPLYLSLLYGLRHPEKTPPPKGDAKVADPTVIKVFFSAIAVFYVVYLVSQLAYFANGFSGILPAGYEFTRAEYARRGFFEMAIIAAINLAVLFVAHILTKENSRGAKIYNTAVSVFICCFTLFIITTAFAKMYFYIENFGLTRLRMGTSAFMILLTLFFLAAILRLFFPKFPYMKAAILSLGLVVAVVGFADIDRCVASYNTHMYETAPEKGIIMDRYTLSGLSDSAIPYMLRLLHAEDDAVAGPVRRELQIRFNFYYEKDADGNFVKTRNANTGLRAWNMTLRKTQDLLLSYADELYVEDPNALWEYEAAEDMYAEDSEVWQEQ